MLTHARAKTLLKEIPTPDLERMKWYGVFYRNRDSPGSYMLRIRITANELTAVQAKEIARIAYELGYGIVDVTTRANIQVQGLDIASVPKSASTSGGGGTHEQADGARQRPQRVRPSAQWRRSRRAHRHAALLSGHH